MSGGDAQEAGPARPNADDIDLRHLLEVLDVALSSDNPAVRDQLQKLLMIATLVSTERPIDRTRGPLSRIFDEVRDLRQRVGKVESEVNTMRGGNRSGLGDLMKPYISKPIPKYPEPHKWTMDSEKIDQDLLKKILGKKDE